MEVCMDYLKKLQIYKSTKITKVLISQPFLSYTLNILNRNSYGLLDQSAKVEKQKSTKIQKKKKNTKKQKRKQIKSTKSTKNTKRAKIPNIAKIGKNAIFIFSYTFFILHVFSAGVECMALSRYLCPRQGRVALLHPELN